MRAPYRLGLLGFGNVGGALARRLIDDADEIARAAGRPVRLQVIAVRHPDGRPMPAPMDRAERLIERSDLDAVVELIGGLEPAHTYIHTALAAGRQVITANKQLIATQGPALALLGPLRFEASVASAIPIVETLAETLAADRIRYVSGILNGTTNSMLDAMAAGASYADALADAQQRGLAEADPIADVDAHDPAAKLAILAMLAFRRRIDPSVIERVGIRGLQHAAFADAGRSGQVVKLVAAATHDGNAVAADVRPRLVPLDSPLARVGGAMNAIAIEAAYAGQLRFEGPGAGPNPAASAVLADIIRAARDAPASAGMLMAGLADLPPADVHPLGSNAPYPAAS